MYHIWPYMDHIWPYMVHIWPYMDHVWPYMNHIYMAAPLLQLFLGSQVGPPSAANLLRKIDFFIFRSVFAHILLIFMIFCHIFIIFGHSLTRIGPVYGPYMVCIWSVYGPFMVCWIITTIFRIASRAAFGGEPPQKNRLVHFSVRFWSYFFTVRSKFDEVRTIRKVSVRSFVWDGSRGEIRDLYEAMLRKLSNAAVYLFLLTCSLTFLF